MFNKFGSTNSNINHQFSESKSLIETTNFTNKRNTLHDNLNDKLNNERVVEYKVIINSKDRNVDMFPSPFDFKVSLGSNNFTPNLEKSFTNIKYATLNSIFLPKTRAIVTSNIDIGDTTYDIYPERSVFDSSTPSSDYYFNAFNIYPYVIVRIKEFDDYHLMGSSPLYQNNTLIFIPDQCHNDCVCYKPKRSSVVYPNSLLKNMSNLSLSVLDFEGNNIGVVDTSGRDILRNEIKSGVGLNYNEYVSTYSNNKYVNYTNNIMQVTYDFTFGVIETELNTLTSYNKF